MENFGPAEEARLARLLRAQHGGENLDAFIRRVSPRHPPPRHIRPIMDLWERTREERVFACIEMPPRHAKTVTGLHGLSWRLARDPSCTNAFATYGDDFAAGRSRIARMLSRAGGVTIPRDASNLHEWSTDQGGGLLAHGYHGEWTGRGINGVALLDDLYKDRQAAESKKIREGIWDWFTDVLWLRLEPGASVLAQFTRWHDDDLIGRLLQGKFAGYHFEEVKLPGVCEDDDDLLGRQIGEALWPERFPIEELRRIEESIGPYSWASLYQQHPRPKGADVFDIDKVARFLLADWRPDGHRILLCCDPAATDDNRADFSAAFVLAAKGYGLDMKIWILHGWRDHVTVPAVARKLYEISMRYWGGAAPVVVESVGGFKAVPQILKEIEPRLRIRPIKPKGDKFTRAQGVAAAWNAGRVFVPLDAELTWDSTIVRVDGSRGGFDLPLDPNSGIRCRPKLRAGVSKDVTWADELLWEADKFTGVGDLEDDQIDALAHGANEMFDIKPAQRGARRNRAAFG